MYTSMAATTCFANFSVLTVCIVCRSVIMNWIPLVPQHGQTPDAVHQVRPAGIAAPIASCRRRRLEPVAQLDIIVACTPNNCDALRATMIISDVFLWIRRWFLISSSDNKSDAKSAMTYESVDVDQ